MIENNDQFQFIASSVFLAMVGGVANWLMADRHTIFQFIVAIFLAGFAGFLVGQLCLDAEISESVSFFLCGSAGLCAELVLKVARRFIITKLGALTDQKVEEELDMIEREYNKRKEELLKRKDKSGSKDSFDLKNFLDK